VIDGADRQREIGGPRGRHRLLVRTAVAGRDHEQRAGALCQLVHRLAHRVGAVARERQAEAHVDDVSARVGGPLHAGDDLVLRAGAVVAEHLADPQVSLRRHAPVPAALGRTGARDRRLDVGAVPVAVDGRLARRIDVLAEVAFLADASGEVGMGRVVAGVQDRHVHAGSGVPGCPRVGRADLGRSLLCGGTRSPVEPDLADRGQASVAGADGGWARAA
jgi:hypothetical protein